MITQLWLLWRFLDPIALSARWALVNLCDGQGQLKMGAFVYLLRVTKGPSLKGLLD